MSKLGGIWFVGLSLGVALAGCGGDDTEAGPTGGSSPDSSTGGSGGGGTGGSGGSGGAEEEAGVDPNVVKRGEYLVNTVLGCPDCHTPRNEMGAPVADKFLAGGLLAKQGPISIYSKNITQDMASGIGGWTDEEIKGAFLDGHDKAGKALLNIMPYWAYHNMTAADADAIVAYLRSVPAVSNTVPANELAQPAPSQPIPEAMIPDSTLPATDPNRASANKGKYLAKLVCIDCHTKDKPTDPVPVDLTKLFAGNREFPAAAFGFPSPPFPEIIYSLNLTPHANGIEGWKAEDVKTALKMGVAKDGTVLCPPMPAGPMGPFGKMTDEDALDIGNYLTSLPAVDNGVIPVSNCSFLIPQGDGGAPEGGAPDGAPPDGSTTTEAGSDTDAGSTTDAASDAATE
jgi:hypothetical protein